VTSFDLSLSLLWKLTVMALATTAAAGCARARDSERAPPQPVGPTPTMSGAATLTAASSSSTPPTRPREGFPFVDAPSVADIGRAPLACVYDGVRFDAGSVLISTQQDDWRTWRLTISSLPLTPSGYPQERADTLDLYLDAKSLVPNRPIVFATNGKDQAGNSRHAQSILRWNDFFGVDAAKDDDGHDSSTNVLRDGQSYVIVLDDFRAATSSDKPGKASGRLYLAMKPTSDLQKKRLPHFREPSGCNGVFKNAPVTNPFAAKR
jgi:hypothetical protein